MKFNRIGYYIKEGVNSIFTHGFMSFASVCIIIACLLIMGTFSLLAVNVRAVIGELEDENVVLAFVDDTVADDAAKALQADIEALPHVESAVFISRDEAMDSFTKSYSNSSLFDNVDSSVLRHRFAVYIDDVANLTVVQNEVKNVPGIAEVNVNLSIAKGFITARTIATSVSVVLIAILFVISLFIMSNTIKLATFERREEIAIEKMVGATSSFIRWPFILEGFFLGIFGAGVSFVAQWGIYELVTEKLIGKIAFVSLVPFAEVQIPLLIAFLGLGFIVGVGGSSMAIKNYLKV